jgi:deoxycytidylate deaminase
MDIEPYFKIAYEEALKSPCTRRKYGSVIVYPGFEINHTAAHNVRIGRCCNSHCVRDRLKVKHGEQTEKGAELHSEIAALITKNPSKGKGFFILVGLNSKTGKRLTNVRPCHSCSLAIKYAGFDDIWVKDEFDNTVVVSISEIIESQEALYYGTPSSDYISE